MKVVEWKIDHKIGIMVQLALAGALIVFGIVFLFNHSTLPILIGLASLFLFVGAFNNYKYYKRKYMTIIYIVAGMLVLSDLIMRLI